jgi:putative ABC transport system permease protein
MLLERAVGAECARSILGDLEEDLARGRGPRWASRAAGVWLLWEAIAHAASARWDGAVRPSRPTRARRRLEVTTMWYDVRDAIRSLRSAPLFTMVALLVLSLTIGASTAIFSVVDAVVLRALPYDEPHQLVQVGTIDRRTGQFDTYQPAQNFTDWVARQDVFTSIAATTAAGGFTVSENGVAKDLAALQVTVGYFDVYRGSPQIGRPFSDGDYREHSARVALISESLWRRHFGADPDVIGRTLRSTAELRYGAPFPVDAGTWTIIGVMPRSFRSPVSGLRHTDVWVPYVVPRSQQARGVDDRRDNLEVTARLADGVTIERADAHVRAITASLAHAHPTWFGEEIGAVRSLHEATVGIVRAWMLLLLGAVGVVLLIASVSVAHLMLARATARGHEMQIRAALGASRWRVARAQLVESLMLSTAGTLVGLLLAVWGINVLRAALPEGLPRISTVALDVRVLAVAALTSVVTGWRSASRPRCSSRAREQPAGCAPAAAALPPEARACARRSLSLRLPWPSCSRWARACSCRVSSVS